VLDEIRRTPVDSRKVRAFTKNVEHGQLAFDLFREAAFWSIALGSIVPAAEQEWSLAEAVVGGHFVRLAKLMRGFLRQTKDIEAELAWVTCRLMTECVINVIYLLENVSEDVLTSYLHQSLYHDRELLRTIEANIAVNGAALPIEKRMLKSIARTFANVEIAPEDLPPKRVQNWGGRTLRQKAASLGMLRVYQVGIAASSRNVHGSWYDLTQHHLTVIGPGRFQPRFDESHVRPQLLFSMARVAVIAFQKYLEYLGGSEMEQPLKRVTELEGRIRLADTLHEEYLTNRSRSNSS
jgi:hypothetical protein